MTNLWLFVLTVCSYFFAGWFLYDFRVIVNGRTFLKRLALLALLCLPININDKVFTVFGNAEGKNGVYSVLSFYQKSECGSALSIFNILGYQKAEMEALVVLGIPAYQRGRKYATLFFGISAYQSSDNLCIIFGGISGYQTGKQDIIVLALSGYQRAGDILNDSRNQRLSKGR